MQLIIASFLCCSWSYMNGQSPDKLSAIWNDATETTEHRLEAAEQLINMLLDNAPNAAFDLIDSMLVLSRKESNQQWEAKSLRALGNAYYLRGVPQKALEVYNQGLQICREIDDKSGIIQALGNLGNTYAALGQFEQARATYLESLGFEVGPDQQILRVKIYRGLANLYSSRGLLKEALDFYSQELAHAQKWRLQEEEAMSFNHLGNTLLQMGNYPAAFENYSRSLQISVEIRDSQLIATNYLNMGNIYSTLQDFTRAQKYYKRIIEINKTSADPMLLFLAYQSLGGNYEHLGQLSNALIQYERCLQIGESLDDPYLMVESHNQLGGNLILQQKYTDAEDHFQASLALLDNFEDDRLSAETHESLGDLYLKQEKIILALESFEAANALYESIGDLRFTAQIQLRIGAVLIERKNPKNASLWCRNSLQYAEQSNTLPIQRAACECLYNAYKSLGNNEEALLFHERWQALGDSLQSNVLQRRVQEMELNRQMELDSVRRIEEKLALNVTHGQELSIEKKRGTSLLLGALAILLIALVLWFQLRLIQKSRTEIQREKEKSEHLLHNILPTAVASELKESGQSAARDFKDVTILFTDFKGFTQMSEAVSPQELVSEINTCFTAFDQIMTKYGIEKIKTIGDAYMAAGGLETSRNSTVKDVVLAALEMQEYIQIRKSERTAMGQPHFEMRVGIHTGDVVAGIVGSHKYQYDIWGDAVNTASRMESSGEQGKVNISHTTYSLLKNDQSFTFENRGIIEVKGKGEMEMWFVNRAE